MFLCDRDRRGCGLGLVVVLSLWLTADGWADPGVPEYCAPMSAQPDTGPFYPVESGAVWEESNPSPDHRLIWHVPADPKGLVFFLHGGGGGAVIVQRLDITDALNKLVDAGFAFAALDSLDRVNNSWDIEPVLTNPDFARLLDVRNSFVAAGHVTAETPVFLWGFSNGGTASLTYSKLADVAGGVPLSAVASHGSQGGGYLLANPSEIISAPAFFTVLENDVAVTGGVVTSDRPDVNAMMYNAAIANGLPAEYRLGLEKAINPLRFTRIPGITQQLAQEIFDILVADGVIDASGLRLLDLGLLGGYSPDLTALSSAPTSSLSLSFIQDEVNRQLDIVWAGHVVSSEYADEQVAFFVAQLPEPGALGVVCVGVVGVLMRRRCGLTRR